MRFKIIFLIVCVLLTGVLSLEDSWRIANNTIPLSYDVHINTTLKEGDFKFNGTVIIKLEVENFPSEIQFHQQLLNIQETLLVSPIGEIIDTTSTPSNTSEKQIYSLKFNAGAHKEIGVYTLTIKYDGNLRQDKLGYYRSNYTNDKGETVWLAATQFAPTYARSAFPCLDEPNKKSVFDITLTHPVNRLAISNMPNISYVINKDNTATTKFQTTPVLPTYLVGFIISDFPHHELIRKNFKQHYFARPNAMNSIQFSETYGADILQHFMDKFTTAPLPLEIMKQIPLPDFHFSGMENFGMVTYRETKLLVDPDMHDARQLVSIMYLMGHEMAHSWFGNLVTMDWWTFVWMKEGFSTMYSYYGSDELQPTWNMMEKFQAGDFQFVMRIDADKGIRPMTHYVETIDGIKKNYDKIAYEKSSCVLQMIDNAIGKEKFKKAVDLYLQKMSFKNVEEDDFIENLEESLKIYGDDSVNITQAMKSWTNQRGYPILFVTVNHENKTLELSQQRFVDKFEKDINDPIYFIPVNFLTSNEKRPDEHTAFTWLKNVSSSISLPEEVSSDDWIVVNINQTGYYRVNYDDKSWDKLTNVMVKRHLELPTRNRAQIVDDLFNLADKGYIKNYTKILDLLEYFKNEEEYSPWDAFNVNVGSLFRHLEDRRAFEGFKKYMKDILKSSFEKVQKQNVQDLLPLQRLTREIIMRHSCRFGLEECDKFSINDKDADLFRVKHCRDVAKGNKDTVENLFKLLKTEDNDNFKNNILLSFGCATNEDVLNFVLQKVFDLKDTPYLDQDDRKTIQQGIYQHSSLGVTTILEFWDTQPKLLEVMGEEKVNELIIDVSMYCFTDRQQKKVTDAFRASPKKSKIEENIQVNRKWANMHEATIDAYFNSGLKASFSLPLLVLFFVSYLF
ncbi:hypothetical protein ACFFRR_000416 [Megaselia abdita]